jgi:uncharacterized integral membrane protein
VEPTSLENALAERASVRNRRPKGASVLKRILWLCVAFPVAALLVTLAVANRHSVRLVLDPFRPETPVLSIVLPFYGYLFGALLIGVLLGGTATWLSQGRWRRATRVRSNEARRWQTEAERLMRERDAEVAARNKALAAPDKRNAA